MDSSRMMSISSILSSLWVFLITFSGQYKRLNGLTPAEIKSHLELGQQLLLRGQYADALSHYHAAVEADPTNYLTYFKRATVYLAVGKSKAALDDLNDVIKLKPDFVAARHQRGVIYLKLGMLDHAHIDFEWVLRLDPYNEEAQRAYTLIEPLKEDLRIADILIHDYNFAGAIDVLTRLIQECPWDSVLREMRATSFEAVGDLPGAISDIRPTTKLVPDNTKGFLKLSQLHYELAEVEESLNEIRECLKLDPDHKECFAHYKKVKKLAAQMRSMQDFISQNQYSDCIEKANAALETENAKTRIVHFIKGRLCHCYNKNNEPVEAISTCTDAIKIIPDDVNILCDRGDAFIANEQFDDAIQDFQKAVNIDESSHRAQEGLNRAQKLLKQSKKRDYYKILGVKRTAQKKEILKAYRKLAQKWHPDNFQEDEKKNAEKKFIDIAAAKEVLTDPEKRQKFDNGEDPLDPDSQAGQGFNPFAQGFHPFGGNGGPFTFKFHFN